MSCLLTFKHPFFISELLNEILKLLENYKYYQFIPEQFTVRAQEPLFLTGLSVVT